MAREEWVGTVTHYYPKAKAAAVRLELGEVRVGDQIRIEAPGVNIRGRILSMEMNHEPIEAGHAGEEIGIAIKDPIPENADVYVVRDEDPARTSR